MCWGQWLFLALDRCYFFLCRKGVEEEQPVSHHPHGVCLMGKPGDHGGLPATNSEWHQCSVLVDPSSQGPDQPQMLTIPMQESWPHLFSGCCQQGEGLSRCL